MRDPGSGCDRLTAPHTLAALLIVATWGLNFTVIRFGLDEFTPFTFATWRFVLCALPIVFVAKPAISWTMLAGIGGFMFAGQFVFLFLAMEAGLPPGLTSVLVQLQGPLTVVLAALFLRERATRGQWLGLAIAAVGVVLIARSVEGPVGILAIGLALCSALTWAAGNLFFRSARGASMFAVTVWASVLPIPPLAAVGLLLDGPTALLTPILAPTWKGWFVLFYTVAPVMWLGYLIWGTLLATYPAAKVGPISLLVPCVALVFAALLVGEPIGGLRLLGVVVVLGGVALGLFASTRRLR
ncbi:MAG: O-acetylserine/cysteine exporter [Alphaproteobacteria bacterium]|nr:O-acetylserine/cysteine exporter [Alphaproteobacteria bacterium]